MKRPADSLMPAAKVCGVAAPLVVLAVAFTGPVQAQNLQPGLWEFKHDIRAPGRPDMAAQMAQLRERMKSMPPQARQMMEQQLASMGVGIGSGGSLRVCMTPEDVRQEPVYEGYRDDDCTYTQVKRSGNTWTGRVTCTDPARQGDFRTTWHGPTHFSTASVLSGAQGRTEMNIDARRISGDCGAVAKRPRR
ncbi:MAG TPA: DUF3617 domain-containing protein [Xanthomonadaceae bacterium]|nr:DUF3617 domain-containing protein [Xanthomonadaceae bacterium]